MTRPLPSREGALEWLRLAGLLRELGSAGGAVDEFTRACRLVRHPGLEEREDGWACRACGGESRDLGVLMEVGCA